MAKQIPRFENALKAAGYYFLHPGMPVTLFLTASLVIFFFAYALFHEFISPFWFILVGAFILYLIAVYVLNLATWIRDTFAFVRSHPTLKSYFDSPDVRASVGLHISLGIDIAYAVLKIFFAVYYESLWQGAVALYYVLLSFCHFYLTLQFWKFRPLDPLVRSEKEISSYRFSAVYLFVLDVAVMAFIIPSIIHGDADEAPLFLLIFNGIYTLFHVVSTVLIFFKYRRDSSSLSHATRCLNLAIALVTIYSFQASLLNFLLTHEGTKDALSKELHMILNSVTGGIVAVSIIGLAVYMMVDARNRRRLQKVREKDLHDNLKRSVQNGDLRF